MNNVVSVFPLLHLPNKAMMHVLRNMGLMQQIGFSLCSEKAKSLIKSLNLKAHNVFIQVREIVCLRINMDRRPSVRIRFLSKKHDSWSNENKQSATEIDITIWNENEERIYLKFDKLGYSIRKWVVHVMEVFNYSKIDELHLQTGYEFYNLESMKETFKETGLKRLSIEQLGPNYTFNEVLKTFLPTKQFWLSVRIKQNPESIQKFLIQNFDCLTLGRPCRVVLNDLLNINSLQVSIRDALLTEKHLNTFLKLWINGSNPRLRYLWAFYTKTDNKRKLNKKKLLKGIKYQVVSKENVRVFKILSRFSDKPFIRKVNSGFDIWRKDGTIATIKTTNKANDYSLRMFIWN